jgi:uncharacterized protein
MDYKLSFNDIKFVEKNGVIRANFLKIYYFEFDKKLLLNFSDFKIIKGDIIFNIKKKINFEKIINQIINEGFNNLMNNLTKKKTIYIHSNSNIPLIGSQYFGIVDRNTNLIEIRPNTGCNLNCIYCSVDEGISSKKNIDFVVEKDYLVGELKKIVKLKDDDDIEIHINPQGEPLLYSPLVDLVKDISSIPNIKRISIDTNATMLTKTIVDNLIKSGLTQFNISIDSLDAKNSEKISGTKYDVTKVINICKYISKKSSLILAPLYLESINDKDIEKIILFSKKINAKIGIQNFLNYNLGRNPVKGISMDNFYLKLKSLEKKYLVKLVYNEKDFLIHKTKKLQIPFKKDEIVNLNLLYSGMQNNEYLAVLKNRVISVISNSNKKKVKAKIVRVKHNIIKAVALN